MKKFEIGKTYECRSACDHNCVWTYEVINRTAKTVTVRDTDDNTIIKARINDQVSEWNARETVFPLGRYSMAPSLKA